MQITVDHNLNDQNVEQRKKPTLKSAVSLALKISVAFVELHDSGVIHINITVDNIIVKENKNYDKSSVKIIDLGVAS
eukprot:11339042-Ditylum_brightwellii.AAC.1